MASVKLLSFWNIYVQGLLWVSGSVYARFNTYTASHNTHTQTHRPTLGRVDQTDITFDGIVGRNHGTVTASALTPHWELNTAALQQIMLFVRFFAIKSHRWIFDAVQLHFTMITKPLVQFLRALHSELIFSQTAAGDFCEQSLRKFPLNISYSQMCVHQYLRSSGWSLAPGLPSAISWALSSSLASLGDGVYWLQIVETLRSVALLFGGVAHCLVFKNSAIWINY